MVEEREETNEVEEAYQFIEIEAFVICEEDNEDGLTWKEVSDCIVSNFIYLGVAIYSKTSIVANFKSLFHNQFAKN